MENQTEEKTENELQPRVSLKGFIISRAQTERKGKMKCKLLCTD